MSGNKAKKATDPRIEYLRSIGLEDATPQDLVAPSVSEIAHRSADPFEWVGNVHPDFEYYRATDDNSVRDAERRGYRELPSDCGVRMRECHTRDERIMVRTVEQGRAYDAANAQRIARIRSGQQSKATPMGGGVELTETVTRSIGMGA